MAFTDLFWGVQTRWRVYGWVLPDVNLDPAFVGYHQCAGVDFVIFCDSGWTLSRDYHEDIVLDQNCWFHMSALITGLHLDYEHCMPLR